jgi:hypothetical protein
LYLSPLLHLQIALRGVPTCLSRLLLQISFLSVEINIRIAFADRCPATSGASPTAISAAEGCYSDANGAAARCLIYRGELRVDSSSSSVLHWFSSSFKESRINSRRFQKRCFFGSIPFMKLLNGSNIRRNVGSDHFSRNSE